MKVRAVALCLRLRLNFRQHLASLACTLCDVLFFAAPACPLSRFCSQQDLRRGQAVPARTSTRPVRDISWFTTDTCGSVSAVS
eukprot:3383597-Rhodomonas_salina.1